MNIFGAQDILDFAVRIEENGETFYRRVARAIDDRDAQQLFNDLANEEVQHKKVFQELSSTITRIELPESYPGEFLEYLYNYIDGKVVFTESATHEIAPERLNPASAIDFAIQKEYDSILYYQEIKELVAENERNLIDRIIQEERKHVAHLSELKKQVRKNN